MKDFDGVVFDMDGVLFDSERMVVLCWQEVAAKYNIPDIQAACTECLGLNKDATKQRFFARYGKNFPYDRYKLEMSALFHQKCSGGKLPRKKGALRLMEALHKKGVPMAVASSSRREVVVRELKDGNLYPYLQAVICGDDVQHSKPAPDSYLMAAKALGLQPARLYAVEDSYNGIRSAHAAGLRPIMVPDRLPPIPTIEALCEKVLPDLLKVKQYLLEEEK